MKITNFIKQRESLLPLLVGAFLFLGSEAWALPEVTDIEDNAPRWQAEESTPRSRYRSGRSNRSSERYRRSERSERAEPVDHSDRSNHTEDQNNPESLPHVADQAKKIESLQQELQELRGKVEEQAHLLSQLQEQQKKNSETAAVAAKMEPLSGMPTESDPQEERAYQAAYHLIQNREYDPALTAFKALVADYPQGKYVPNGHYWLGEIYLVKGDLPLAAQSFDIVFRRYPEHPKAADSLLKMGYIEHANSRWQQAKDYLNQVKTQYPGSTSAQLAQGRLDKIRQEGH